jgi:hypothetical protein
MTATTFMNMPSALRGMLDAFVSSWMRWAAAQAEQGPSPQCTSSTDTFTTMPLASPNFSELPPFQLLDPGVLNASIPAFFIGRAKDGFWVARDAKGQNGGIFLLESSALAFARRHCAPSGCATIFLSERFELDLENQGNPLIVCLRPLKRLATQAWLRVADLAGKIAEAAERRFRDFHAP